MGQYSLKRELDTVIEAAFSSAELIESHQFRKIRGRCRLAKCPGCQRGHDAVRASLFVFRRSRLAREHLLAAQRVRRAGSIVRTFDPQASNVRVEGEAGKPAGFDGA